MHSSIIITDLNGSRRLSHEQLPLNIGTEQGAHIRLPEWEGSGSFAQISMLDDRCFVQPQNSQVSLKLNGVSLVTPKWLDDGDVLSIGEVDIELHDDGDEIEFEVFLSSEETETAPPQDGSFEVIAEIPGDTTIGRDFAAQSAVDNDVTDSESNPERPAESGNVADELSAGDVAPDRPEYGRDAEYEHSDETEDHVQDAPAGELADPQESAVARALTEILEPLPVMPPREAAPEVDEPPAARGGWLVRACWLLLLAVIAYVALSSRVAVTTFPSAAEVTMKPRWLAPGRAGRFFLPPGHYDFVVAAPGYKAARGSVDVAFLERKTVSMQLEEKPGRLFFELPPGIAGELWIDGERVAQLDDLPVGLTKGVHEFRIVTDLYQEYSGSVDIVGRDELQVIAADLVPEWGSFAVATQPPGAAIYFGEKLLGTTPATVDVGAGEHELELRLQGYRTVRKSVDSIAGEVVMLPMINLQHIGASIQLTTRPASAFRIEDSEADE